MSLYSSAKYDISVMMIFAAIGIIIKLFFAQTPSADGSTGPANATIWGYGVVAMSMLCTIFIKYALGSGGEILTERVGKEGALKFVWGLVKQIIPVTVVFGILIWTIILNATFITQINKGEVSPTYSNLSWTSSFLILFQLMLVFRIVLSELRHGEDENTAKEIQLEALSYLLGTLNFVMLGIMNISLVFFSTDG